MKINRLTIENFKNYHGENDFDLTVTDEDNIVLIGGENGSGKTTIQEAVRLCLYGRSIDGQRMTESDYSSYISGSFNKHAESEGVRRMGVTVELTLDDDFPPFDIRISRNFEMKSKKRPKEEFIITQNGQVVEMVDSDFWEDYVKSIMPPAAAKYFFFDGERVKDVIASSQAENYIRDAIEAISGLSSLRALKEDLLFLKKRNIKNHIDSSAKEEIEKAESELASHNDTIQSVVDEISSKEERLSELMREKNDIEEEVRKRTGYREDEIRYLQKQISEADSEMRDLKKELTVFYKETLPFTICRSELECLMIQSKREKEERLNRQAKELISSLIESKQEEIAADVSHIIERESDVRFLLETIEKHVLISDDEPNLKTTPYLSDEQLVGIEEKYNDVMESEGYAKKIKRYEELNTKLNNYKRRQRAVDSDDVNGEFSEHMDELRRNITMIEMEILEKEELRRSLETEGNSLAERIENMERGQVLEEFYREKDALLERLISELEDRIDRKTAENVDVLGVHINSIYKRMMHKEDMVERITFSRDGFKIGLIGFNGENVNRHTISEGEKGLLALSVQYGLARLSKRQFPMIVDSPLGKMDSFHVNKILREYYPNAGNQIVILSHDREITHDLYGIIRERVARSYLLSLHDKDKVSEGYFQAV